MSFHLKIFLPAADKVVTVTEAQLLQVGTQEDASKLTDEKALYEAMRSSDIEMVHRPYPPGVAKDPSVRVFGTFYVNLSAFTGIAKKP